MLRFLALGRAKNDDDDDDGPLHASCGDRRLERKKSKQEGTKVMDAS
jgi:hypothetical protein